MSLFISLCRFPVLSLIQCKLFYDHSRVCNFVIFSYCIQQCVKFVLVKFEIRVTGVCGYRLKGLLSLIDDIAQCTAYEF